MTDKIVLSSKELHKLYHFSMQNPEQNIVLDITETPIGNIYKVATQDDYKSTIQGNFAINWQDITSYEEW